MFGDTVQSHTQDMDSTLAYFTAHFAFLPLPGPPIRGGTTPFPQSDLSPSQCQTLQKAAAVWQPIHQEDEVFSMTEECSPK